MKINLTDAIGDVWSRDPVLGAVLGGMDMKPDESGRIKTMATDGRSLLINEAWAGKLTRNQVGAVLAHEALHVVRGHAARRVGDPQTWNIAADAAINHELVAVRWPGSDWIQETGCTAEKLKLPEGRSAEEYAKTLKAAQQQPPPPPPPDEPGSEPGKDEDEGDTQEGESKGESDNPDETPPSEAQEGSEGETEKGTGDGDGRSTSTNLDGAGSGYGADGKPVMDGEVLDDPEPDPAKREAEHQQRVLQAIETVEQSGGRLPTWAAKLKGELTAPPKIDWKALLRRWMLQRAKIKRTFERPSRRQAVLGGELIRPGKGGKRVGKVAILVDVSGSMSSWHRELEQAMTEVENLAKTLPDTEVRVICWDHTVESVEDVKTGTRPTVHYTGGGTQVQPALREAAKWRPDVQLVWTDAYIVDYPARLLIPTMWMVVTGNIVPQRCGQTVRVTKGR